MKKKGEPKYLDLFGDFKKDTLNSPKTSTMKNKSSWLNSCPTNKESYREKHNKRLWETLYSGIGIKRIKK